MTTKPICDCNDLEVYSYLDLHHGAEWKRGGPLLVRRTKPLEFVKRSISRSVGTLGTDRHAHIQPSLISFIEHLTDSVLLYARIQQLPESHTQRCYSWLAFAGTSVFIGHSNFCRVTLITCLSLVFSSQLFCSGRPGPYLCLRQLHHQMLGG